MLAVLVAILAFSGLALAALGLAGIGRPESWRVSGQAGRPIATFAATLLSQARRAVAGPRDILHETLRLPDDGTSRSTPFITVDVWHSAAAGRRERRLLLYTPGSGKTRRDNAATAADLAARGFVVVALDDIEQAPELAQSGMRPLAFDFSSGSAYEATLGDGDVKVALQAARLSSVLDRLAALQRQPDAPAWLAGLPLDRVGAFGWSFGGSTAAEASIGDPRIVAVANLDGWLFGMAARGGVAVPYLLMLSDFPFPADPVLDDPVPERRYEARLTRRDLIEERRLIERPESLAIRFPRTVHENLSDLAAAPAYWRTWFRVDPIRTKALADSCLAAFFGRHLHDQADDGRKDAGCLDESVLPSGVERLHTLAW
ncbi:hypothetical protein MWN34_10085 [Ancylobacter sp. 6x-1]|uniref:Dienelactone hydrolase n=1 Tax=Ancylobacter crimeensis TaxID=2579147 RepID=A0ABT0DBB9_9HYPH|nr:hypothetical protein [Ancylobacter crimeensis]MCK0197261.1 hypothetical protein [Ancylobacter crimeensis]